MRPYLAVISDSFRAALASRVLWILLAVITLCLAGLAPLGARRVLSSELKLFDFLNPLGLARQLHNEFESRQPSPGQRIFRLLDPSTQKALRDTVEGAAPEIDEVGFRLRGLLSDLNNLLNRRDFYEEQAWRNVTLNDEAQELMDRGISNLSDTELRRLNRLLLESAYSGLIAVSPPTSLQLQYAGVDINGPLPISGEAFQQVLRQILALFMYYLIGVAAVLVAILVTSPVIPHTIETGAIELLLSKPISRIFLFLAKFIGSCAFIFVNASYLIGGLWLIAGIRFDIWEHKLLLCIPIFLFRFAIYYSVSALAGLVWRSAIVSVVVTMIFWTVCFSVEQAKVRIENSWIRPHRIVNIFPAASGSLVVTRDKSVLQWNADQQHWQELSRPTNRRSFFGRLFGFPTRGMLGPIYDNRGDLLLSADLPFRRGAGTSAGDFLHAAAAVNEWQRVAVAELPSGTTWLGSDTHGNVIAVAQKGVYRLDHDQIQVVDRRPDDKLFVDLPKFGVVYQPDDRKSWTPRAATLDAQSDQLAVWHGRHLTTLGTNGAGEYVLKNQKQLDADDTTATLALAVDTVLVARHNGQISLYDTESLEPRDQLRPESDNPPRIALAAPDGRWLGVVFRNGRLWLYDADQNQSLRPSLAGQGDISAAAFHEDQLLLASGANRVRQYQTAGFRLEKQLAPKMELLDRLYYYVALPIYRVFPRPGELDTTIAHLLADDQPAEPDRKSHDLEGARMAVDPWSPITNSLAFTLVVLLLCCAYMHWTDF